jgi:hypothetical protein
LFSNLYYLAQAAAFHRFCDGHANTLVLIFNDKGNIFGGFSGSAQWQSTNYTYHASSGAFLFLLSGRDERAPLLLPLIDPHDGCALRNISDYGPIFGKGVADLTVADAMTTYSNRCSPRTYRPRRLGYYDDTTLAGARNWAVKDIEVWQLR